MKKSLTLILFFCLNVNFLFALHIIGGVMTYECLGGGDYEFTMKVYRDCNGGGAEFDGEAFIAVYQCGVGGTDCSSLSRGDRIFRMDVPLTDTKSIPNPDYPCLIPPDVCVEEGVYIWKLSDFNVSFPSINESYYVAYQRCCRNETINNLNRPSEQGSTFVAEVTPDAQSQCNSSPQFDDFPPTVICAGEPLVFNHSATDADGDRIVYEFCAPLNGGGRGGNGCNSPRPNPACPPPYSDINFLLPTYSAGAPMGGNPVISIDPNTGIITGTPEIIGQFVVGICATEYRNGIAIGRVYRDFQFNVGNCDPLIVSTMEADEIIGDNFIIKSCAEPIISLNNTSFQEQFINDFFWQFNINGRFVRNDDWDPTFDFEKPGTYTGHLYLNPGTMCGDTADVTIHVYPELTAGFDFFYDTCVAGAVQFTGTSFVDGVSISKFNWNFGDGNFSEMENPSHNYAEPGFKQARLSVTDENGCQNSITKSFTWQPVPNLIVIAPSAEQGCVPYDVVFDNLSVPIDETYEFNWDFGDGKTSDEISPVNRFTEPGLYDVAVEITSPIGCFTDTVFEKLIYIDGGPVADFSYSPLMLNSFDRTVQLQNQSLRTDFHTWSFNEDYQTIDENPSYTFPDTGVQVIRLTTVHEFGCRDTMEVLIDVVPEVTFYLPNAFTPNYDTNNDFYQGVGYTEGVRNFQMTIWNRWGEVVFQTSDPNEGWNGLKNNAGRPAPGGTYVVVVRYEGPRGQPSEMTGTVTVIR